MVHNELTEVVHIISYIGKQKEIIDNVEGEIYQQAQSTVWPSCSRHKAYLAIASLHLGSAIYKHSRLSTKNACGEGLKFHQLWTV